MCLQSARIRTKLGEADNSWRWNEDLPSSRRQAQHLYDSQGQEPFCLKFKNELRWSEAMTVLEREAIANAIAVPPTELHPTLLVYLAHPVSGDFDNNIARAHRWFAWSNGPDAREILGIDSDIVVIAPWLVQPKSVDHVPEARMRHMKWCTLAAARCDEVWLVGGRVSKGMQEEADVARRVRDLSSLGVEPPEPKSNGV